MGAPVHDTQIFLHRYLGINFRKGLPVHNGIGLIFTGAIEILVSTITSLSVCALVGFRVTMIPCIQVEAVVKTSITLPVKERIAEGLSRAGTSNTLKVLTYNIILGVIAFFARGATRQFCAFAVVVLVAHWFLVHTFFVAVLSIDLQRLELEELLQQNASFTPSVQPVAPRQTTQPNGRGRKSMTTLQGLLRGRATKNISLLLLLATTGTLYFATYPANRHTPSIPTSIPLAQQRKQDLLSGGGDPAWHTWRMLNPRGDPLVHLRIEAPTLLMFHPADASHSTTRPQPLHCGRPALSYSWVVGTTARMTRIIVLPIAATVAALYALLLYLLKDAERLEAQRHQAEADSLPLQSADPPTTPLAFSVLPRAHSTDIELLAVSADGRTAAGVSLENELILWANGSVAPIALGAADVLSAGPSNLSAAITALALDDTGSLCAAEPESWRFGPYRLLRGSTSFSPTLPDDMPTVFMTYENGTIFKWDGATPDSPVLISPPQGHHVPWSSVLRIPDTDRLVAAYSIEDGSLDIIELIELVSGFGPPLAAVCRLQAGNPTNIVASFHACLVELDGMGTLVIAAATEAGVISLWDDTTSSCTALLEEPHGALSAQRLCPASRKPCMACGAPQPDGFALAITAALTVQLFRVFLPPDITSSAVSSSPRCTCVHNSPPQPEAPPWGPPLGLHSRNSSTASTTPVQPSRSRHASMSEDNTSFPISGNGVLSRRASEKDSLRRAAASNTLAVPESKLDGPLGPPSAPHIPARWRSLVVGRVVDTMCERGAWDVTGSRVVGLRRRSRRPPDLDASKAADAVPRTQRDCGLSAASLERWEAWTDVRPRRGSHERVAACGAPADRLGAVCGRERDAAAAFYACWAARERADVLSCWVREHG
ncbi:sterol-sensing domain of SREBP cleavage-activation-domain-containing protein [Lactarius pseudohatsudake]|nr:sterol-sensing domain of SREBP cleavage-activation-domain-containing protein [Lactarius pseudohatsudake]